MLHSWMLFLLWIVKKGSRYINPSLISTTVSQDIVTVLTSYSLAVGFCKQLLFELHSISLTSVLMKKTMTCSLQLNEIWLIRSLIFMAFRGWSNRFKWILDSHSFIHAPTHNFMPVISTSQNTKLTTTTSRKCYSRGFIWMVTLKGFIHRLKKKS